MHRIIPTKIFTIVLLFIAVNATAQLTVTTNNNPTQLAQKILGQGITVLNAQFKGTSFSAGTFKAVPGSFLIDSGIVLTSGAAKTANGRIGVDNPGSTQAAVNSGTEADLTDADLNTYSGGGVSHNACVLEFDFIPQGDSVYIRYIFGSEEYPEYACTQFNDVFAFFISGPGYLQKRNIALVPTSIGSIPVTINSVNSGVPGSSGGNITNCQAWPGSPFPQYYVDNQAGNHVVYDGHTVILTAKAKVTPCQTYHIKLAIGDITDQSHDSGVFIEANSFTSKKEINTSTQGPYTDPSNNNNVTMIEACKNAQLKLTRADGVTGAFSLATTYAGTATPNVDFTTDLPSTVTFTANENEKTFTFTPLADALTEGSEKVVVRFSKGTCATTYVDSAIFFIKDSLIYRSKLDTGFCTSTPITIKGHDPVAAVTNDYLWSTGANTQSVTVTQPGVYTVTHTYSQRCLNVDTFNVISKDPTITFNSQNVAICPGESATLTVTTNTSGFTWNNGATTNSITVNAAGKYWVTATNTTCTRTDTVFVTMKPAPLVELGNNRSICQGQPLILDATYPGATYVWSNGATTPTISVTTAGQYSVINTLNGCIAKDTIVVGVDPLPVVDFGSDISICEGKSVTLDATFTGATHTWNTGATTATLTVTTAGKYYVTNDLNGCIASDTINVAIKPLPALELGADRSVCEGDTIHLDATYTGATYVWSTGATTGAIIASAAGKYKVTSTLNGCDAVDSMTLTLKPIPVVHLGDDISICDNKSAVLDATYPGALSVWSTGDLTPSITVNTGGLYHVINNLNGCSARDTIIVTTKPSPALELGADRSICEGDTIHLNATYPGATYVWSNGATTGAIIASADGKYKVTSSLNGCDAVDSMTLTLKPIPVVSFGSDVSICENTTITLNAAYTGSNHLWSTGATTPSLVVSTTGDYWAENTLNGCTSRDTIKVTTKPAPLLDLGIDTSLCDYESITLNAGYTGATYVWSTGETTASIVVNKTGDYSVISTLSGCPAYDTITIAAKKMPVVNAGLNMIVQQNITAQLNATQHSNNASYLWSPAATLNNAAIANPVASPTDPVTEYTLHVVSVDGCVAEDKVTVRVVFPVKIPNAFSPNGDGINDKWTITNIELYPRSRVYIFNRYGQQVYSASGTAAPWDGTNKGKVLEPSTYYYVIDIGDGQKYTGYVVLLR